MCCVVDVFNVCYFCVKLNDMYVFWFFMFVLFFLAIFLSCVVGKYFYFIVDVKIVYEKVIDFWFGEVYVLLVKVCLQELDNFIVYYIENYIDFFKLYINENEEEYKQLKVKCDCWFVMIVEKGNFNLFYYCFV